MKPYEAEAPRCADDAERSPVREHKLRLARVFMAALARYSLMPADWLTIALGAVEKMAPTGGGLESWVKQLETKRGVHIMAQLAFGVMHRDTYDGALLMLDAIMRLRARKRSDPRDDRAFQDCVAPYYEPIILDLDDDEEVERRISGTWSGKTVPHLLTDDEHQAAVDERANA